MKRRYYKVGSFFVIIMGALFFSLTRGGDGRGDVWQIGTSGDYPPFEYHKNGELIGFDIELMERVAKHLDHQVSWKQFSFDNLVGALEAQLIDMAVSGISATEMRSKKIDFSSPYYTPSFAVVYKENKPITEIDGMFGKKIGAQTGSTMEFFLKDMVESSPEGRKTKSFSLNDNGVLIEELKLERIDGVLLETLQAKAYVKANPKLQYTELPANTEINGYAIGYRPGFEMQSKIEKVLQKMEESGELEELRQKWLTH